MRLSNHDASFLYSETASGPMHGVGITVVEGNLSYEQVLTFNEERIHLVPRFRQRLVFVPGNIAHPKWVDDPYFDITNHVQRFDVADGTTLEELIPQALVLGEKLLDRSKPLWRTYVAENIEGNTVLIQMSHHAMMDGASAVAAAMAMSDHEPSAPPVPAPTEDWRPAPLPTPLELWAEAVEENTRKAFNTTVQNADASLVAKGNAIMQRFVTEPVMTAPWNASLIGPKRSLAWTTYRLDDLKALKQVVGGTINDVVLTIVSEAAARYMAKKGEWVQGQYLRLMCPVNVREEGDDDLGNKVSALYSRLPAWPMGIRERHEAVQTEMSKLKANDEARALHALTQSQSETPAAAMAGTLNVGTPFDPTAMAAQNPTPAPRHFGPRPALVGFNFTCTNVPGDPEQTYIRGHRILFGTGTMMIGGTLGLGVACGSANGQMGISFTADPRLIPDVQEICDEMRTAYEELQELAAEELRTSMPAEENLQIAAGA